MPNPSGGALAAIFIALLIGVTVWVFWVSPRLKHISAFDWDWLLVFRDGQFLKLLPPGKHVLFGRTVTTLTFDRRSQLLLIARQEVLTKDGLGLKLSLVVQYKIDDPLAYVRGVPSANTGMGMHHLHTLAQLPIRAAAAKSTLDDILANRDAIPTEVAAALAEQFKPLGLSLVDVAIRDIMLGREIRDAFAAPAIALKQGQAALERARGEVASMRALANAARMARDNPELMKLRALQHTDAARQTLVVDLGTTSAARAVAQDDSAQDTQ